MMKNENNLLLIEGTFDSAEARDILINIFRTKILFHERNNFSSQERFGKDHETAKRRIPALHIELEKLESILANAQSQNRKLIIHSEIRIGTLDT